MTDTPNSTELTTLEIDSPVLPDDDTVDFPPAPLPPERFLNRELSWLAFNDRVLAEANDPTVPIFERVKFLAIYASNLDEFFMVRVAALRRQIEAGLETLGPDGLAPAEAMQLIVARVHQSQENIGRCFREKILPDLAAAGIFLLDEKSVNEEQKVYLVDYFNKSLKPVLTPLALDPAHPFPRLENKALYFCVELARKRKPANQPRARLVLLQIPTPLFGRFVRIPAAEGMLPFIRLDDVIRLNLAPLFPGDIVLGCYEIKVVRDAELEFDEEAPNLLESMAKTLEQRRTAPATRFLYDAEMPPRVIDMFCQQLRLEPENMFRGARYHSFADFFQFPGVDLPALQYPPMPPQALPALEKSESFFAAMRERDLLLHHPYQKFDYVIRLLEQAAADPEVLAIKMTLYRVSPKSKVAEALARAAKSGKQVTVLVELKARFDEEANIRWSHQLRDAGAHVIFGLQGLKTHCKLCLIIRREGSALRRYCHLSTGNYNDRTAQFYGDLALFTCREEICVEVEGVFNFLTGYAAPERYEHLLVAPEHLRPGLITRIRREAENAAAGKPAAIVAKMNSLVDTEIIDELYRASCAGVQIQLIIRGICCLRPGVPGLSENIRVISILDRFLEHARVYIFANGGAREYFLASADWMPRNLDRRVEVAFPIYDPALQQQVQEMIDTQLADNVKARVLQPDNTCVFNRNDQPPLRAQMAHYEAARQLTRA
ncbi:MAG: Polyphosphate kinase [bacterium]|nr:Polyphosphate kinase [bacterium]